MMEWGANMDKKIIIAIVVVAVVVVVECRPAFC
jgi:hypothetical protein